MGRIYEKIKQFPFTPGNKPFFYGWIILIAGIIGMLISVPGQTIGVSVFTDPLLEALRVSRVNLSNAYMFGTFLSALLITRAGYFYDRFGARITAVSAGFCLGLVLFFFSRIDRIVFGMHDLFNFTEHVILAGVLATLGFFGLRFFGQGVLTMLSRNMVMKWFDARRGFVNMFLGAFVAVGFSLAPQFFNSLIENFTWRGAWFYISIFAGIFFPVFAFIFFRDNPHMYGLIPDGSLVKPKKLLISRKSNSVRDYELSEVKREFLFWIFNLALVMNALYITAITFHIESIFETAGMTKQQAISIFFPTAIIALIFSIAGNFSSDYIKLKYLLYIDITGLLFSSVALVLLRDSFFITGLLIFGNGMANGMFGVISAITWPRFFGLKSLGAISGYSTSWWVAGSAVGPFLFSLSFRFIGNYKMAAMFCAIVSLVLLFLAVRSKKIEK
ncbi:MAG: MFS transporter [Bacteroidota bacterium]